MKTKKITIVIALLILGNLISTVTMAQTPNVTNVPDSSKEAPSKNKLSGYIEMNYYRHYLWRGALWGNNDVSQPELHLDYGNFSFAITPNLNIFPKNLPEEFYTKKVVFDEQDVELGYQNKIGKLEYQALLWGYFYFNQINTPSTGEIYLKLEYPLVKNTKIFTENVADIGSYKGAFYNSTGVVYEKSIKQLIVECKLFSAFGNKAFNEAYYETSKPTLSFVGSSLNLEYDFKSGFYIAAKGEYNKYTNAAIRNATGLNKTDNFSVYFGYQF